MDLYSRVRSRPVLHHAWAKVRSSGLRSDSETTNRKTREFDANWLNNLQRIQTDLRNRSFCFDGERGVAAPKAKGKSGHRPLVVAPIKNRIVRRALLDVLQGYGDKTASSRSFWSGVPAIREIMNTPTSIGGIPARGVPHALAIIDDAVAAGKSHFARSDIRNFFTRIPKADVVDFVRTHVNDPIFSEIFARALETQLDNQAELEERKLFKLFPDPQIGVAQGSALSALAGNIALKEFDREMNDRGIVCVRYIDDFILLGDTNAKVHAAYLSARARLQRVGMDIYDLHCPASLNDTKAAHGNIFDGTEFLGYQISGRSRQPAKAARRNLLAKLDKVVEEAKFGMEQLAARSNSGRCLTYHQAMVDLNEIVWGWCQAFKHTTARHVFVDVDNQIGERIRELDRFLVKLTATTNPVVRRRVRGIHLLQDTDNSQLPQVSVLESRACATQEFIRQIAS